MFETFFILSIILLTAASGLSIYSLHGDSDRFHARARRFFYLAGAFFLASGAVRYYPFGLRDFVRIASTIWGHFYILSFFLFLILAYIDLFRWKAHWRAVAAVALPFIAVVCALSLPFMGSDRAMEVGLANHLLPFHVILAVMGQLFFFFSFAGSVLGISLEDRLRRRSSLRSIQHFPSLEAIDAFVGWSLKRAAAFLAAGIVMGVALVWVNFGRIYLFSFKETVIYISLLFIAVLLLLRRDGRIGMMKLNAVNAALFGVVLAMYIASNVIMKTGFHSFR